MSKVTLLKTNFQSGSYINTIDTNFTELVPPSPVTIEDNLPTVNEFFDDYSTLFFTIPKTGENSHTTLIETSIEYIGFVPQSLEIEALQQEITFLREQLLELRAQLNDVTNTTSNVANDVLAQANSKETVPNIEVPPRTQPKSTPIRNKNIKKLVKPASRQSVNDRQDDREDFA